MPGELLQRLLGWQALAAFRYRDFRLLWTGAFVSFCGSWIQNVAQGWLVYELTNDEAMLALVMFFQQIPVFFLGPVAGTLADVVNRRFLMVASHTLFGSMALLLAYLSWTGQVQYWHIVAVSLVQGVLMSIDIPARQSLVSAVVPREVIAAAIPIQAMTFNVARIVGPAIGGVLLAKYGPAVSYGVNGMSFVAMVFAALAIRADISGTRVVSGPIRDLIFEGMRYTLRDQRLRALFLLETTTAVCGLFYISLMPAIARDKLGLGEQGLGNLYTATGVGAICGLLLLMILSLKPVKALLVRVSMTTMALALLGLSVAPSKPVALVFLALAGASSIMQFNTTNTLFQLLAPPELRGRVLAMHMWALSGLGPFGLPLFGYVAREWNTARALALGGACIGLVAAISWAFRLPPADPAGVSDDLL